MTATTASRLLEVAARLFRERGYARTTTREMAARLGIQKASLYHHIRSKENVLHDLSVLSLSRISQDVDSAVASSADPAERLRLAILAHTTSALRDRDMHASMLVDLRALSPVPLRDVVQRRNLYQSKLRRLVEDAQTAGAVRGDIDAEMLTLSLLNLLNWSIFWYREDGRRSPEQLAETFATLFLEGARAQPATPARLEMVTKTADPLTQG